MKVAFYTNKPSLAGEMAEVIRLFFGEIVFLLNPPKTEEGALAIHQQMTQTEEGWHFCLQVEKEQFEKREGLPSVALESRKDLIYKRYEKRYAKQLLYEALKKRTGKSLPWGSLTGIRPTRLVYEQMAGGLPARQAAKEVEKIFDLQPEKAQLLEEVVGFQQKMGLPEPKGVSVYIGIPFCTTRCSYCTFSGGEIGDGKLTQPYVEALLWEMEETAKIIRSKNLRLRTLYVGGGTPTALRVGQIRQILSKMISLYAGAREVTVEAGRPDTINEEKLAVLREAGVGRISINPQTMKGETLVKIGRNHTPEDTLKAYDLARKMGFDHINMDLIAGLPQESLGDFRNTLDQVLPLKPQSLTVHSLALKRGSRLWDMRNALNSSENTAEMIALARRRAKEQGLLPYYLYRQKYMAENQENVGYALEGFGCQYNVDMMEEITHIFAMGAGGISKRVDPKQGRIERAPNVSDIETYIDRVDEMVERKKRLWENVNF